jgi:hypothetical protein
MIDKKQQIADTIAANEALEAADKVAKSGLYSKTTSGMDIRSASPTELDSGLYKHGFEGKAAEKKNFDEKIFMFPESYNALRRELSTFWPTLWQQVQWKMANRAEEFVEDMNAACDVAVVFDTSAVDFISKTYLARLRTMRGVSV